MNSAASDSFAGEYLKLEERLLSAILRGEIPETEFDTLALEVFEFQRRRNRLYDAFFRHVGVGTPAGWRQIPAVPGGMFRRYALKSFPDDAGCAVFRTSGTSGEGQGAHHFFSLRLYEAAAARGFVMAGLPPLFQIVLVPTAADAPHSSLSRMMSFLKPCGKGQRTVVGADGRLREYELREALETAAAGGQPVMLLGTALAFLNWFERGGPRVVLPAGSCVFETGGYKGSGREMDKATLYALFGEFLGLEPESVFNEYGMTELTSQFYSRGVGRPHRGPPWMKARVIDPASGLEAGDGSPGVLRILDLANLGSVVAIETRDLAIRRGADFELLGRDPGAIPRGCSRSADERMR